jgi:hypothetical protein
MTYDGSQSVAVPGTAVQLETGYNPCYTLTVQAIKPDGSTNTGVIYLGGKTVSSLRGLVLSPGVFFTFPPTETNPYNLDDIWIDAASANDGVRFISSRR